MQPQEKKDSGEQGDSFRASPPSVTLPKGGGAIRGIGEKFSANPVTGTGSFSVPIATSPGRGGFGPQLSIHYDSGAGNGPFGLGWRLELPSISRKTDKGIPAYRDEEASDVFLLAGAEDLVPVLVEDNGNWRRAAPRSESIANKPYSAIAYRPRVEGLFASIERWTSIDGGDMFWRTITRDNVTTYYGRTAESRVAQGANTSSWLVCETHDDRGNVVLYDYKREDRAGVDPSPAHERNRAASPVSSNVYLKRIRYGNTPSRLAPGYPAQATWHFEVVFDYGEGHYEERPADAQGRVFVRASADEQAGRPWAVRQDPFSSYRSGFEVRTYRLCRRVLMFHRFPALGDEPVLVKSTRFDYEEGPGATHLGSVTHSGYVAFPGREGVFRRSLPPLEFSYSQAPSSMDLARLPIEEVPAASLQNLPAGFDDTGYRWVDLDGEGISGVLAERNGAWYYKRNLGEGRFGPMQQVPAHPSIAATGAARLMDLAGDGQLDVVVAEAMFSGFMERTRDDGWEAFRPFENIPNLSWRDPNVRFIDLTGDGLADLVVSEDRAFVWHRSLGESGFGPAQRVARLLDEEKGPQLVFADATQSLFLADMSGDGLTDLVRIRNGDVSYWPNLGYGRFGARVAMDDAPWFDHSDAFDPARICLADVNGSGTTDVVYLHRDAPVLYFNRSGNAWSAGFALPQFPRVDNLSHVQAVDLLGRGTACLVWSSPLAGDAQRPLRYIDLMAGTKPHLMVRVDNNLGATTRLEYKPSTHFYLEDRAGGRPWATRLPFPVHVVTRITTEDKWRGTKFSSTYSYHHGYFDGEEREFRGFGRVEQVDVEAYGTFSEGNVGSPYITDDRELFQPPVKTITWFHTGMAADRDRMLAVFEQEYFRPPGFTEPSLPQPAIPAGLDAGEWREAGRACKGMMLRQEVFELDVDELAAGRQAPVRMFSAAFHNCEVRCLQPRGGNRHAVFLVAQSEAITFHYEHDLRLPGAAADPRVAHTLNLDIDEYGNVREAVAVAYPRLGTHADAALTAGQLALVRQVQNGERHVAMSGTRYTGDVLGPDVRRLRIPCEARTWEVTGITPPAGGYFTLAGLRAAALSGPGAIEIPYHQLPDHASPQRRLVDCQRTLFFADDLANPRPLGEAGPRALPFESYKLALTQDLLQGVFEGTTHLSAALGALAEQSGNFPVSGYRRGDALFTDNPVTTAPLDEQYWIASGVAGFEPDAADHFFLPERYTDPFGNVTRLEFDPLDFFVRSSTDAMGNASTVERFDYRVLAPAEMLDPNGNRTEAGFDALGLVVAAAAKGKAVGGGWEGDTLQGFDREILDPPVAGIVAFCNASSLDEMQARAWLLGASSRFVYHFGERIGPQGEILWNDRMAGACGISREVHAGQPGGANSPLQVALECSDGGGNVLMKKARAEPDPATGQARWLVNGLTVLNNKGKPVKQYEPAFSPRFGCELPQANGATTVTYYDAAGRVVRTERPDGTFSRAEFSPWHVRSFDPNDTVLESTWYARNSAATARPEDRRAARLAALHANTPALTLFDSLGREVVAVAHNRVPSEEPAFANVALDDRPWRDRRSLTFTRLDSEGKLLWIVDARGNRVMQYVAPYGPNRTPLYDDLAPDWRPVYDAPAGSIPCYDIAGNMLFQHSMDAGDRWMLMDAAGKPMLAWDANDARDDATGQTALQQRVYRTRYDALHRPTQQWLAIDGAAAALIEAFEYCDTANPNGAADLADARRRNLVGQAVDHRDPSGRMTVESVGFKGNVEEVTRTLVADVAAPVVDWNVADWPALLEAEAFRQITEYDALDRMTRHYSWHRDVTPGASDRVAVYEPEYNQRGLLKSETLHARARKQPDGDGRPNFVSDPARAQQAVVDIAYNEKGQKLSLSLGNGTVTRYGYDPETFRLLSLRTERAATGAAQRRLQDIAYTYDPAGNIVHIHDAAQPTFWTNNAQVRPGHDYVYDALYRLIEGTGRENTALPSPPGHGESPWPRGGIPQADVPRNYVQRYLYDEVGNFVQMRHLPDQGPGWTRNYAVQADSNRLDRTWYGNDVATAVTYRHDPHGNMLNLDATSPGTDLRWDWRDMIRAVDMVGGGIARYNYGIDKQRTRKHITRNAAAGGTTTEDRIYLGGYELYRRRNAQGEVVEEIESLHLFEGEQRVLLVDDVILARGARPDGLPVPEQTLWRYQFGNHLGSVGLELDGAARIISYEEFHPYGTSAYRLMNSAVEAPPRRYRYTGMERDEESGLGYHAARYCSSLLGRWVSTDPQGISDGLNIYLYARCDPINKLDATGKQAMPSTEQMYLIENIEVPTWALRGKTEAYHSLIRRFVSSEAYSYGLDPADFVNGHASDTPHFSTPAGRPQVIKPQTATSNAQQSALERAAAGRVRASNNQLRAQGKQGPLQFLREGRIDLFAPKGMKTPGDVPEFVRTQAEAFDPANPPQRPTATSGRSLSPEPFQTELDLGSTRSIKGAVTPSKAANLELELGPTRSLKPPPAAGIPGSGGKWVPGGAMAIAPGAIGVIWTELRKDNTEHMKLLLKSTPENLSMEDKEFAEGLGWQVKINPETGQKVWWRTSSLDQLLSNMVYFLLTFDNSEDRYSDTPPEDLYRL